MLYRLPNGNNRTGDCTFLRRQGLLLTEKRYFKNFDKLPWRLSGFVQGKEDPGRNLK
jgi:hypothetical protein